MAAMGYGKGWGGAGPGRRETAKTRNQVMAEQSGVHMHACP